MNLPFVKMHGTGNDFVLLDCMHSPDYNFSELARVLCRRRIGIGADGLLAICPSDTADFRMRIFNADGSEAQICGNGLRCAGKYAYDNKVVNSITPLVETGAGLRKLTLTTDSSDKVQSVKVDMGMICTAPADVPVNTVTPLINSPVDNCGEKIRITALSVGNPHGVVFVDDLYDCKFELLGPRLECHEIWPEKANIEFVRIIDSHHIAMRAWERGVGETLACGSGACAAAAAAVINRYAEWPVEVQLCGGLLTIDLSNDNTLVMNGPATEVFRGIYTI
ncbi:MAG: diaminopimelate epimerase [Muribaculaceae bacterium]|nr:diaminopimelate epimerase [Muribaculaceae bacterium]